MVVIDVSLILPQLMLSNIYLQWINCIKYHDVYIIAEICLHKCSKESEDIKSNIIQRSCLEVMFHQTGAVLFKPF